jgi:dTDP-4-dehydrorhamnose 3,5-epimerase
MLKGIIIKAIERVNDERGFFTEVFREDWKDLPDKDRPVQANLSTTYPGIIRAWHRHARGQTDYFLVITGALRICAYDDKTRELDEIISTETDLQVVRIPGHYWHGFKVVGNEKARLVYFTTKLYDYMNPDEERRPWNDKKILPKTINGNRDDPRVGKPWNWNLLPHK